VPYGLPFNGPLHEESIVVVERSLYEYR
jgi:hypothetical protein